MIKYERVKSSSEPEEVEVTATNVFIAENIAPYTEVLEGKTISGFIYDCVAYTKDEYIKLLDEQNKSLLNELLDTQMALCEIYEVIGGDN